MFCQYQPVPWTLVLQYLSYHASQNKYVHKYGFANPHHFVGPYSNLKLEITFTIYNFKAMAQILSRRRPWWNAAKLVPAQLCALLVSSQNCWPNFPLKLLYFSEKQNVDPRVHLPRCLQAELHLFSGHCLWCYRGMKGILDPFFRTSAHATQAQVVIHFHCSLNEDLTPWQTTYGRPRTRGNCGRSDPACPSFDQLLKLPPLQDIRHKYENKEEEEEE